MKILFVARHFSPENTIGAIRLTKYAKYLSRLGHEVRVYAMDPTIRVRDEILAEDAANLTVFPIHNSGFYRAVHGFFAKRDPSSGGKAQVSSPAAAPAGPGMKKKIFECMYRIMHIWSDLDFVLHYRACTKHDKAHYDIVLSSWNTAAAHEIALDVFRHKKADVFVADFRDACVSPWPELTKNRDAKRLLRRVYEKASLVTVAFPSLIIDNRVPKNLPSAVFFNGFDPEDHAKIPDSFPPDGRLHLAYCGQIYDGFQDFTPLFAALSELIEAGKIDPARIAIDYAGQSFGRLFAQAKGFSVQNVIENHGFLPREQALALQKNADILLFAAWNSVKKPAIFPAKFPEYMMMAKPVVALISGELADSLPARIMKKTRLGFAFEAVRGDVSQRELKEYLSLQYERYLSDEHLHFEPDTEAVTAFSYPVLAETLSKALEEIKR